MADISSPESCSYGPIKQLPPTTSLIQLLEGGVVIAITQGFEGPESRMSVRLGKLSERARDVVDALLARAMQELHGHNPTRATVDFPVANRTISDPYHPAVTVNYPVYPAGSATPNIDKLSLAAFDQGLDAVQDIEGQSVTSRQLIGEAVIAAIRSGEPITA